MNESDRYRTMINTHMKPYLESKGFRGATDIFRRQYDRNWGLISFQKSVRSDQDAVVFTVNVGTISRRLYEFDGYHVAIDTLRDEHCHWRERLGYLMPERRDIWWTLDRSSNVDELASGLVRLIDRYAIPEMQRYVSDEQLTELWLTGCSPGITDLVRLEHLSVMLKAAKRYELLSRVVSELRDLAAKKPHVSQGVQVHLKLLQERVP
jgi:hypothetical protein